MAGFMAVGADDGHLSECAIFAIKKNNGTYVWPEARLGLEKPVASGWRVRCSLMPAAMLEIHGAALRVLWGLLEANPLRRCARRRRWAPSTIDYTHHDQKKDRARQPPATLAPSHPKPLHAGNSQAPACGAPASRQRVRPQTWPAAFAFLARQATASRGKGRPFWHKRETGISSAR